MTHDAQARALVQAMRDDSTILDDLPDSGWVSVKIEDLVVHIADHIRAARPTWTDERPTEPGWYAWRLYDDEDAEVVKVCIEGERIFFLRVGNVDQVERSKGQWARIEMPEEKP